MTTTAVRRNAWLLLLITPLLPGCELVGDIFKLGIWAGVIMIGVLAVVVYAIFRFMKRT